MNNQEFRHILLGILVFLLVLGSWSIYHQITITDVLKYDEILIPTDDGEWTRSIFFIEEPTKNLDTYKMKNDNKLFPDFYRVSIPEIKPETQRYLDLRNEYIKKFEKKFFNTVIYNEWGTESIFLKPFDTLELIEEILPFTKNGKNMILVIGREQNDIYFSKFYLLDDNFQLIHQLNETKYNHACVLSSKFLERIWIQKIGIAGTSYSISIDQIDVSYNLLKMNQIYQETEYEVEGVFDTFKVTQASTNPRLSVYNKGKSDFLFFAFIFLAMPLVHAGSIILGSQIFPYIIGLSILFLLLFLYHKQIASYFHNLRK